jgi:hypothetical protein
MEAFPRSKESRWRWRIWAKGRAWGCQLDPNWYYPPMEVGPPEIEPTLL